MDGSNRPGSEATGRRQERLAPGIQAGEVAPVRILVVDDEESLMLALCNILQQQGYATTGCIAAEEALATLERESFDLLLTDLMMPGTSGLTLVQRALAHAPELAVVMMTGQGSVETAVKAMQSGAIDYVLKPFKLNTMLPVLERALSLRRLRMENAALHQSLLARTQELEMANRELEAYAATVSHDLRAPLRGIDGLAQQLAHQLTGLLKPDTTRLLNLLSERAQRAQRLVEDLLRLSRVGRQPLACADVDIGTLARDVLQELGTGRSAMGFTVAPEMPLAYADGALLRQLLVNLIGNAVKFTRETDAPHIDIGGRWSNGRRVYHVADNGPGFDMQQSGTLFMPFARLKGAERFEGSGVGLSIVQRIAQRHGGHVWVEAAPGKGACFYFTLDNMATPAASLAST